MSLIRCNKKTYRLLVAKKRITGKNMTDLIEYAVINMPYVTSDKNVFKKNK